jgi:WD40 repeat protein
VVVGASGAGKSSLLNAGLIPAVRNGALAVPGSDAWPYLLMSPGGSPLRELAIRVATLAGISAPSVEADLRADPTGFSVNVRQALHALSDRLSPAGRPGGGGRLILVVDQFEELFTQCHDQEERQAFVRALCAAASAPSRSEAPSAVVVLGLRADFYTECTGHPELVALLEGSQVVVGPMTRDELRHSIERPAQLADLSLEPGLVDAILHDLDARLAAGDHPRYDPGRLPLLSHAVLETWELRRDRVLTLAGYHAAGGIERAVTTTAEGLYGALGEREQAMVRQLLLRLVVVSASALEDARGRVSRAELLRKRNAADRQAIQTALDALVGARLVTAAEDSFEITHEALLRAWPRLQGWIERDREWLAVRHHLSESAASWERGDGDLYSKNQLSRVHEQIDDSRRAELDHRETAFLVESERHEARAERSERRRGLVLRGLAVVLTLLLAVTAGLTIFARTQSSIADQQRRIALSRQLAADADGLRPTDPATSALLAIEALRIDDTTEARSSVLSTQSPYYTALPTPGSGPVNGVALSPDGLTLASAGQQGAIELWDVSSHQLIAVLRDDGNVSPIQSVAFSPDGRTLASTQLSGRVALWDLNHRTLSADLPANWGAISSAAYSPTGGTLAAGGRDGIVRIWDTTTHELTGTLAGLEGPSSPVNGVAFSRDGRTVASASGDGAVVLWDVNTHDQITLGKHAGPARAVAFSPDGRTLASGGDDGSVRLWDTVSREPSVIEAVSSTDPIRAVAFAPDGRILAAGSGKGRVQLWDASSKATLTALAGPTAAVLGLAFASNGTLAAAEADATIGLWDLGASSVLAGASGPPSPTGGSLAIASRGPEILATGGGDPSITLRRNGNLYASLTDKHGVPSALAISADGGTLAAATPDGDVTLWDPITGASLDVLPGDGAAVDALAFSPSGQYLATAGADAPVTVWNVHTDKVVASVTKHPGTITGLAFSHDGSIIASAGDDGTIVLTKMLSGALVRVLTGHVGAVQAVTFSSDGRTLASGGVDAQVKLWTAAHDVSLLGHTGPVISVAFSPDGSMLASAGKDHTVMLWRVADGSTLAALHGADVTALAFTSDRHKLAGVDRRGKAVFWDVDANRVMSRICSNHPVLTPAESRQYLGSDQPDEPICP